MINRDNWRLVKEYISYRTGLNRFSSKSIRLEETWLDHTLLWLGDKSIDQAPKIKPSFSEFVTSSEKQYSKEYARKLISANRRFIIWVSLHKEGYRKKLNPAWIDDLQLPSISDVDKDHEYVSYDEIMQMAHAPVDTLRDQRIQAAAILWFLSGIRIGAFVTLPIKAVNLDQLEIYQFPSLGVQTKLRKKGTTDLLDLPELLEIPKRWDKLVRSQLPDTSFWFAPLSPETGSFDRSITAVGKNRSQRAYKDLKDWLDRAGLPFHSPHKFRHGYATYCMNHYKELPQLKAFSQNLMHSSITITDSVYGILSNASKKKNLLKLNPEKNETSEDLIQKLDEILKLIKQNTPNNLE
ncbi:MAG: hypothetical protein CVU43_08855 [Chloroflexi bacterium HGW-Chloroflexi-5]|jgi:integrase|nr:MAG: hypothetical protein CVU43_08855 [Chloroflexi bacterium HGW-Chloroflexi-5]